MRSSRSSAEHQEAVSRRLALLSAELAAVRSRRRPGRMPGRRGPRVAPDEEPAGRRGRGGPPARSPGPAAGPGPARRSPTGARPRPGGPAPGVAGLRLAAGPRAGPAERGRGGGGGRPGGHLLVAAALAAGARCGPGAGRTGRRGAGDARWASHRPARPPSGPTGTLVVDVAGRVRRPGIAVLDPGVAGGRRARGRRGAPGPGST